MESSPLSQWPKTELNRPTAPSHHDLDCTVMHSVGLDTQSSGTSAPNSQVGCKPGPDESELAASARTDFSKNSSVETEDAAKAKKSAPHRRVSFADQWGKRLVEVAFISPRIHHMI
ncbi:unnamed protein product [Protopolystoma xenopodis]|uniref:Uncharacterized protein n=1 Tax=Protopolystoma xenopodis TaxID=117903 RepID=A0A448WNL6_9PLAT|nr:unnamed protein product [Protopolystoma xenopodis]